MLRTFREPEAETLFHRQPPRHLPPELCRPALRKLAILDSAVRLSDLQRLPENHLSTLAGGSHKGLHEVAIADGWTLRFRWMDGGAYKVELVGP
jgi:plasmid maintenance system killer protein